MEINVRYLKMIHGIHEQTMQNHDGSYTVLLNSRDSHEMNLLWYKHALQHIERRDWEKNDIQEIEHDAHSDD